MNFFNYNIVPLDEYKEAITNNINYMKDSFGEEGCNNFLNFIVQESDREKVLNKLEEYINTLSVDAETENGLYFVTKVLFNCINGDLESVCSTYDIDQGHLGDYEDNHVYDVIKQETLDSISELAGDNLEHGEYL